jgi:hypothetical protein
MRKILNIFLITNLGLLLSSCDYLKLRNFNPTVAGSPKMQWIYDGPPPRKDGKEYPELYVEGWVHGCETGVSANTNAWYKFFYKFRQDAYKAQDKVYYKGWKDALNYCGRYMYQWNRKPGF